MAIKKSELYSSLWESCDKLRGTGGMDASQYKDYVLTMLFVKYVSDKYAGNPMSLIEIPTGASFDDMVALKGQPDIGDRINKEILRPLFASNGLEGSLEIVDFNDDEKLGSGKEKVELLSKLIAIFENPALNFKNNRAEDDDILGDAYEFLMRHFATESGKSKGQFYTPAEVSRILSKVIDVNKGKFEVHQRVYVISEFKENILGKFIYLKMLYGFYYHALTNSVKATVDSLRLPTFLEFNVDVPPTIEEQITIAEIISDMEKEIEQLETKKAKYQDIKQGMMQELLTGKTRLV